MAGLDTKPKVDMGSARAWTSTTLFLGLAASIYTFTSLLFSAIAGPSSIRSSVAGLLAGDKPPLHTHPLVHQPLQPQVLIPSKGDTATASGVEEKASSGLVLTAYLEPIHFSDWEVKPLPIRSNNSAQELRSIKYPSVKSCSDVPHGLPANQYPDDDPFLPWLHDAFEVDNGERYVQFVAQNRRKCHTGTTPKEQRILHQTQPNVALFQHVPVKRISIDNETRYQLTTHEQADKDGVATRFICRFKTSTAGEVSILGETLSLFNFDYDWASYRKKQKATFRQEYASVKSPHTSQLLFQCPFPENMHDQTNLWVDLIPIRTPPRYGPPNAFLQPRYNAANTTAPPEDRFDPRVEWGDQHVLPPVEQSGRWENIPVCPINRQVAQTKNLDNTHGANEPALAKTKKYKLTACIWASAAYFSRGNLRFIADGQRQFLEWFHHHRNAGVQHVYLYDNSANPKHHNESVSLKPIADLFPNDITYVPWPHADCNNNPNSVDSPGETSSQYAAVSSCHLRHGPDTEWMTHLDLDEYLVPMGNHTGLRPVLDALNDDDTKILSLASWRAMPRWDRLQTPIVPIHNASICGGQEACFDPTVPLHQTVLQAYNCDRQPLAVPRRVVPAEKQIYRPEYVLQKGIFYSPVTQTSAQGFPEHGPGKDPRARFANQTHEVALLHAKKLGPFETRGWELACRRNGDDQKGAPCRVGTPFPQDYDKDKGPTHRATKAKDGYAYNCYPNPRIEDHWGPLLERTLRQHHGALLSRGVEEESPVKIA